MVIKFSKENSFIPEWNNNKGEAHPIEVTHKAPSMSLYSNLIPKPEIKMNMDTNGQMEGGETTLVIDNTKLVKDMVTKIDNLFYEDENGKEIPIKDGRGLFGSDVPSYLSGLVDEIGSYLQGILNKKVPDSKN